MRIFKDKSGELGTVGMVAFMLLGLLLLGGLICLGIIVIKQNLYGGKTIECTEDFGTNWTAKISNDLGDIFWYLSREDGIKFKSAEGKIMQCRGSYKEL